MKSLVSLILWLFPVIVYAHVSCNYCHINDTPTTANATLTSSVPELCIACHTNRVGKNEHIIDVPPPAGMSQALPLTDGLLSCTTCHDPHSQMPALLRLNTSELCRTCHQGK